MNETERGSIAASIRDSTGRAPSAIFVSDLHLEEQEGPRHRAFREFLRVLCSFEKPPPLFILGDLFNYWVGRSSEKYPGHQFTLRCMRDAAGAGLPISILRGNRDFLMDGGVEIASGASIISNSISMTLGPHRVLACHGDLLLLQDRSHLRFRWILRSRWLRVLLDGLPDRLIDRLAGALRRRSIRITAKKHPGIFEVPPEAAARLFRGGYDVLICGHVHSPSRRVMKVDGEFRDLYTLGAWEREGSFLEFSEDGFHFRAFPIIQA